MNLIIPEIASKVKRLSSQHYGNHTLDAISGAGKTKSPKLALVFINPTHRNVSTRKEWTGLKAPWIGCSNIWNLFADAGLIDDSINKEIQHAKTSWSYKFTDKVYSHVAEKNLYITNIVKWAGLDAKLPERAKIDMYLPLLIEELTLLDPQRIIAFGQLTFDALLRSLELEKAKFSEMNEKTLDTNRLEYVNSKIGSIVPCYFPVGQGIKNKDKAVEILKIANSR
jgi:hypothetical protein